MPPEKDDPKGPPKRERRRERRESTLVKERVKRPRRYKVVMHNDDFTPMEFVVMVLEQYFHKSPAEATRIMLTVHKEGVGIAGVYTREVAETKAVRTVQAARERGYPLLVEAIPE